MPRIARIVIPHYRLHVTQRGNRRQRVFFNDEDYIFYKILCKRKPGPQRKM
jgi:putative transposase